MPPRLQCLNAVRNAVSIPSLRMRFSTSRTAFAGSPDKSKASGMSSDGFMGLRSLVEIAQRKQVDIAERARKERAINEANPLTIAEEAELYVTRADLTKQIHRRWKVGNIYAPHDLSGAEMAKWKKRGTVTRDVFDVAAFDPIATGSYKNFSIMSEYVTAMGRIKGSKETGLRPVNQRKIARAIRRAVGLGLMPSVHRHPEILYNAREKARLNDNYKSSKMY